MIRDVIRSMRIPQWTKNLVLFAGAVFTLKVLDPHYALSAVLGFLAFSLATSGVYLLNDVLDVERDRLHPQKRGRPVASGHLPVAVAVPAAILLLAAGIAGCFALGPRFGMSAVGYVALTITYSLALKHVVLLDVLAIAVGFVIRAAAGVELLRDRLGSAAAVELSPWLLVCAFFLALFLAIGKRRHELAMLEGDAARHRVALGRYTLRLLDQLVSVVTSATVLAYSIYTIAPETVAKFHGRPLFVTIPFVLYGIFRYLYLMYAEEKGGNPTELLLTDRATLINVLLWCGVVILVLAWPEG
ncbi:MAG TPA: decaprenyl-phosphate phosphoribosyltransferase [Candidatus Limnocylindrales bacterium]|nr:decaprenyl-phosphate phosphoribosyltransferase [Candidatus Limnocylindrales bacterium]